MEYFKAFWEHDLSDLPVWFYSEIDENRYEVRKVEVNKDETFGLAGEGLEWGVTRLGYVPVPSIDEINSEPEFFAQVISKEEFEIIWIKYVDLLKRTNH